MHEVDQAHQLDQDNFSIMERASSPSQVRRSSSKDLLVAAAFGLMLGVGVLLILNRFDDRLYTVGEFSDRFELSLLGTIPEIPADQTNEVIHPDDERTLFAESYRKLRSSILYRQWDREVPQTMLVTSAIPFDGKSTVASNLAAVLARSGSEVLLIDGDLRRGALHQRFGTDGALGFGNVIRGELPIFEAITQTDATNLDFLPRGTTSNTTAEAFLKPSTQQLFTELKAVYDYIVIDSAPVLVADDTLSLAPLVDTSLFVIRLDRTPARFAEKAIQALDQRQVEVGGAVLNFDQSFTGEYYAYDYAKYYAKFANT
jgi:capsular exopolysaccharide synthesis family protein